MRPKSRSVAPGKRRGFDVETYLESAGPARRVVKFRRGEVVFSQGDPGNDVRYIQKGAIKLSVLSRIGKEAVVAMLAPGDFFGEGVLAGQPVRIATATAVAASSVLIIEKEAMVRLLHNEPAFADRFIAFMLTRNMRIEADLVDQLFNSSEKRLARTLLLLARYGNANPPADGAEDLSGDARGNDRGDAFAGELLHEQVQEARAHRVQRRPQDQHLAAQHRPARLMQGRRPSIP